MHAVELEEPVPLAAGCGEGLAGGPTETDLERVAGPQKLAEGLGDATLGVVHGVNYLAHKKNEAHTWHLRPTVTQLHVLDTTNLAHRHTDDAVQFA